MNKQDLIKTVASDAGLTHAQAAATIESITTAITKSFKKGKDVILVVSGASRSPRKSWEMMRFRPD